MTLVFPAFMMVSDGCIYDKIHYDFKTVDGGFIPDFMSSEPANLTLKVKTNEI